MVQTDVAQLSTECSEWRQALRNYRDEFGTDKKSLQDLCKSNLSKQQLHEVEHFQNQFHIQLINLHDLKQAIKTHERQVQQEAGNIDETVYKEHERLLDEFLNLDNTLQELRSDFKNFISIISR